MIQYNFTDDDVKLVEKFIEIKNKGYYVSGAELTEAYNRILHKNVNVTQCGSCLRARVQELENALNHYKAKMASEALKESEQTTIKEPQNKTIVEAVSSPKSKRKKES